MINEFKSMILKSGKDVFEPKDISEWNKPWFYFNSVDGYSVMATESMNGSSLSLYSSYNPTRENGTGELLAQLFSIDEAMEIANKPVEPLFFVKDAGKRWSLDELVEKSSRKLVKVEK